MAQTSGENQNPTKTYIRLAETSFGQLSASLSESHKKITKLRSDGDMKAAIEESSRLLNFARNMVKRLELDDKMADTFGVDLPIGAIVSTGGKNSATYCKVRAHRDAADKIWSPVVSVANKYVIVHRASENIQSDQLQARLKDDHKVDSTAHTIAEI